MASIADLFFTGRLDDGPLQVDAKKAGDKAGATLGSRLSAGIKKGSGDLVQGLKLGAGIAAFGGLTAAISGTVSVLGDAVQAAREDEESQSRLGAALKANIPNWKGNTDAIEATIASRQRLGFTDEEQRTSLALLVVATKDATKALELQRAAMDLARLKGISLEEASSALIKVENGQFRALKALGIQLRQGATATEALAAVQKAAAGSAEAFANTSQGKLLASQIKVGEAMEKLGYVLLPAVATATEVAADAIENLIGVLDDLKPVLDAVGKFITTEVDGLVGWTQAIESATGGWLDMVDTTRGQVPHILKDVRSTGKGFEDMGTSVRTTGKGFEDSFDSMASTATTDATKIRRASRDIRTSLLADATALVTSYYDVLIARDELYTTNAEINALRKIAAGRNLTHEEQANLHRLEQTQAQLEADLAAHGDTQSHEFTATMADLLNRLKTAHGKEKAMIQAEITQLKLLAIAAKMANGKLLTLNETIAITLAKGGYVTAAGAGTGSGGHPAGTGHTATGGTLRPGEASWVGERGPELWVPEVAGRVIPHGQSVQMASQSSGGQTINQNIYGTPMQPVTPRIIALEARRISRLHRLPGSPAEGFDD